MSNPSNAQDLIGRIAVDSEGNKVGKIGQVYLDDHTQQPVWVTVRTGMFGTKETFAPLYGSTVTGDTLMLGVSKDLIKDAPSVEADGHLEDEENERLYWHYADYFGTSGQAASYTEGDTASSSREDLSGSGQVQGYDTSGPTTDEAMTRSEERLRVGTENVESGRARLRKYVVTENVTTTVPVSHEEIRVVREPITEENRDAALSGADITSEEHEITLHAERPVVSKETVPVERVKLATETVTEDQEVTEQVRKEMIDENPEIITDGDLSNKR